MHRLELDYLGMQEINLNLHRLPATKQWKDRWKMLPRHHTSAATNKHFNPDRRRKHGGVGQLVHPKLSHQIMKTDEDPTGLGRWIWARFRGRDGITLRIVCACRPVQDTTANPGTVYSQQETHFLRQGQHQDPRHALLQDLRDEVDKWKRDGDLLILGMDANENARQGFPANWARSAGLVDALQQKHPHLPPVATHDRNQQSIPVDMLLCSPALEGEKGGMLGFGETDYMSDHRLLWMDFVKSSLFGYTPSPVHLLQPNRLLLTDPKVVKKYHKLLSTAMNRTFLPNRVFQLEQQRPFGIAEQSEHDELFLENFTMRQRATKQCRKLHVSEVPSSDVIMKAQDRIHLWRLMLKHRKKRRVSKRKLRRLMHSTDSWNAFNLTVNQLEKEHKQSMRQHRKEKKEAERHRQEFKDRLCKRRAEQYKTSVKAQEKLIGNKFKQRNTCRRIRQVTGKNSAALQVVTAPGPNGSEQ